MFQKYILPYIVFIIYRLWFATWRITIAENESLKNRIKNKEPFILAHWHGDELAMIHMVSRYRFATMTSTSKDGEIVNKVIHLLGGNTSRGSSTRGAVSALKGLIRLIKGGGYNCSVAVDGPKGPYHKVKPGVFEIAYLLKIPIYAASAASNRAYHFPKAWNKAFLPKLFSHVHIHWEGPFNVSENDDVKSPELALNLEKLLEVAKQQALKAIDE